MSPFDTLRLARRLEGVRSRTVFLTGHVSWETLRKQHISILSPMVWDLGHIGQFEDMWIGRHLGNRPIETEAYEKMFDPVANPRPTREGLPLPEREELDGYLHRVRKKTLETLQSLLEDPAADQREAELVVEMVAEHEEQHQETLLQAMQVLSDPPYSPPERRALPASDRLVDDEEMVEIPGGAFEMGAPEGGFAYDNERKRHTVEVETFLIDRFPVSIRRFLAFVEEDPYRREDLWSEGGRSWLAAEGRGVAAPRNWIREEGEWFVRHLDRTDPVGDVLDLPAVHVCFWEAEAFARWEGKRLPTEAEWEKAALWAPVEGRSRPWPWGDVPPDPERANVDQLAFGPTPIGSYPAGASPLGVEQAIGDVWEWTSSDFLPYPGFEAYPYEEYSQVFFGDEYKVLRGGSWATRPAVARGTLRNWDYPIRRQIFAGLRCARDTEEA